MLTYFQLGYLMAEFKKGTFIFTDEFMDAYFEIVYFENGELNDRAFFEFWAGADERISEKDAKSRG